MSVRFVRKISDRGVLTIPTDIREALEVEEGDIVEFEVLRVVKKKGKSGNIDTPAVPASAEGTL
jgi:AbrB family looped-hinge helix DNA binding protein